MDWQDERYVRLFVRDTADWLTWPWQARALLPLLMRKADRVGRISMGKAGVRGLAALVAMPEEVIDVGLSGLLDDGCVVRDDLELLIRNFQPAQEAAQSDAQRQREHREAQRAKSLESKKTGYKMSRGVTTSHDQSRNVTLAVPSQPSQPSVPSEDQRHSATSPPRHDLEEQIFTLWAEKLNHPRAILDVKRRKLIRDRIAEGLGLEQAKLALDGVLVDIAAWSDRRRFDGIEYVFDNRASVEKFMDLAARGNPKPLLDVRSGHVRAEDMDFSNIPIGRIEP
jgi:hypothetical protein